MSDLKVVFLCCNRIGDYLFAHLQELVQKHYDYIIVRIIEQKSKVACLVATIADLVHAREGGF
jgi:hypothetical protein